MIAGGVFPFPLRVHKQYAWENTWLLAFFFALICIPFTVVGIFLPVWKQAVAAAGTGTVLAAVGFGFLWGWGAVTYAIGITSLGISVGYATIKGLATAVGSIIPMVRRWDRIPGEARVFILLGIAVCLAGVVPLRARWSHSRAGGVGRNRFVGTQEAVEVVFDRPRLVHSLRISQRLR